MDGATVAAATPWPEAATAEPTAEETAVVPTLDGVSWLALVAFLGMLLAFDALCFQPPVQTGRMSVRTAAKLTFFWFSMGVVFNIFVLSRLGWDAGIGFMQGLMLEYMLSFDNLFMFHLVFAYYCTPEHLLYRALYFGIVGAILLRIVFLIVGTVLQSTHLYIVKFFLGVLLIWSGIKSVNESEEDEETRDPTKNPCVAAITKLLPVSDHYDPQGRFFVDVPDAEVGPASDEEGGVMMDEDGQPLHADSDMLRPTFPRLESFEGASLLDQERSSASRVALMKEEPMAWADGGLDGQLASGEFAVTRRRGPMRRKASLLLLVVVAVCVVDLLFAVDSVASKVAVVDDIFLNCASSAFAMMSLRSLFFVMEALVETFDTLKYGIAIILVLIGLKLILSGIVRVSTMASFAILVAVLLGSMTTSYWAPRFTDGGGGGSRQERGSFDREPQDREGSHGLLSRAGVQRHQVQHADDEDEEEEEAARLQQEELERAPLREELGTQPSGTALATAAADARGGNGGDEERGASRRVAEGGASAASLMEAATPSSA